MSLPSQVRPPRGPRALTLIVVLTAIVVGFAAAVAAWMYWIVGALAA